MASSKAHPIHVIEPAMRAVPEGSFSMGCPDGCAAGRDDERPAHRVWVDAFELAAYQTANAQYAAFLEATRPAAFSPAFYPGGLQVKPAPVWPLLWNDPDFNQPAQPVVGVSWFDAVAYCEWLSFATGKRYRLPTEAEWERAATAGAPGALYPWGDTPPEDLPDYANRWKSGPESVGLYAPTAHGLYNLGDNVHEWCADWYDAGYYAVSADRNPQGPTTGSRRASRGGSWRHHIKVTRTTARSSIPPEFKYADYGFRVARDADHSSGSTG